MTNEYYCPQVCGNMFSYDPYASQGYGHPAAPRQQDMMKNTVMNGASGRLVCKPKHEIIRAALCHNHTVRATKDGVFRDIPCNFSKANGNKSECTMVHFCNGMAAVEVWKSHPVLCPFEMMTGRCNMANKCTFMHCLDNSPCADEYMPAKLAFMHYWNQYGAVCLQSEGQKVGQKVTRITKPYSTQEKLQKLQAAFEELKPFCDGSVSVQEVINTLVTIGDEFNERSLTFVLLTRFLETNCNDTECAITILNMVATNTQSSTAHVQDAIVHLAKRLQDTQREPMPLARAYGQVTMDLFDFLSKATHPQAYEREISDAMLEIFSHVMDMNPHAMQTKGYFVSMWERMMRDHSHVLRMPSIARSPIINSVVNMLRQ